MTIYIVTCTLMDNNVFGAYSSVKRARTAIEHFLNEAPQVTKYRDIGDYYYAIYTKNGEEHGAEIMWNILDEEFVTPIDPLED